MGLIFLLTFLLVVVLNAVSITEPPIIPITTNNNNTDTQLELSHTCDVSCSGNSVSTELKPLDRSLFFGIDKQWANYFLESINVQPVSAYACIYTFTLIGG